MSQTTTPGIQMLNVNTHEILPGDIVHAWGMRVAMVGPLDRYRPDEENGPTCRQRGIILNREAVDSASVPYSFTPQNEVGQYTWAIQGNGLARWLVERWVD